MASRCDRQVEEARKRVRALATRALEEGRPVAWFEELYREAGGDASRVPWADLEPNPAFAAWAARPGALDGVRTAAVVGCGLGHDAEHLAARGIAVTAFDVSPTAIAWAKRLHPETRVRYEVADLLAPPAAWRGAFDLAVEVYTLQALPAALRGRAAAAIVDLLAPGGRLFVYTRLREEGPLDERASGPPWPLARSELRAYVAGLSPRDALVEAPDAADPSLVRAHGTWTRSR